MSVKLQGAMAGSAALHGTSVSMKAQDQKGKRKRGRPPKHQSQPMPVHLSRLAGVEEIVARCAGLKDITIRAGSTVRLYFIEAHPTVFAAHNRILTGSPLAASTTNG